VDVIIKSETPENTLGEGGNTKSALLMTLKRKLVHMCD
jgi:hypothetical protein